jgi:hypothetical protein
VPTLVEWVAGRTEAGEELPAEKVEAYRAIAAREAEPAPRGLGDTVKNVLAAVGVDKLVHAAWPDCGCSNRQAWLNKMWPYKSSSD